MLSYLRQFRGIDVVAGLLLVALGAIVLIEAFRLQSGTARSTGPGYFPFYIGLLLVVLGLAIMFVEGRRAPQRLPAFIVFKPLLFITASMLVFSLLIERVGLVPALAATVLICTLAERRWMLVRSVALIIFIPLVCYLIFTVVLGLQIPPFRWSIWT